MPPNKWKRAESGSVVVKIITTFRHPVFTLAGNRTTRRIVLSCGLAEELKHFRFLLIFASERKHMRKENSSNAINEQQLRGDCGTAYTLSLIGGRWKPSILWRLLDGKLRYSELKKSITGISERVLVLQLRELENDQLIKRIVYPEVPPRVEYELTPLGLSMESMLQHISDWGVMHREKSMARSAVNKRTTTERAMVDKG